MSVACLLVAALLASGPQLPEDSTRMETIIDNALHKTGADYFSAERSFRLASSSSDIPQVSYPNPDALSSLVLLVLREWKQPAAEEFDRALEYLETLPERLKKTPITSPSPIGIASYLSKHYGSRVADLMAVHLIKQTDWPEWRVSGVLLYLREQARPSTTAALIRFASKTQDKRWMHIALQTIRAAHDPQLRSKLESEERIAEEEQRHLPRELTELTESR